MGFWGPPGTPSSNRAPLGVPPLVVNTQPTPQAYQEMYPAGSDTRYFLHSSTSRYASTLHTGVTENEIAFMRAKEASPPFPSTATEDSSLASSSSMWLVCIGIGIGLLLRFLCDAFMATKRHVQCEKVGSSPLPLLFGVTGHSRRCGYVPVGDGDEPPL